MSQLIFKKMLASMAAVLLVTGLLVSQAGATSICPSCTELVFTYDATIVAGGGLDYSNGPYGTMTLTDDGDNISINIDLAGLADGYDIRLFYLNWTQADTPDLSITGTGGSAGDNFSAAFGTYNAGVYAGTFDIWFNADDPLPTPPDEPYSGDLSAVLGIEGFNLDPCFFYEGDTDGVGQVYSALRVFTGDTNFWIVATTADCAPVPEPSTMLLLGAGLLGLVGLGRKFRKE
jgi:hypothetical protein